MTLLELHHLYPKIEKVLNGKQQVFCFVQINRFGLMTSKNVTKLFQVFFFFYKGEINPARKLAQMPITLSFLFTWLCLVSPLFNQSLVTYH